jgi:hypothetical protein
MGRGALQYLVGRSYREAGVASRVPQGALVHALRHTFATRLAEDGASAVEIMRLLGHASLTTSQNYIDATAREQRAAVRASRTNIALRALLADDDGGEEADDGDDGDYDDSETRTNRGAGGIAVSQATRTGARGTGLPAGVDRDADADADADADVPADSGTAQADIPADGAGLAGRGPGGGDMITGS